MIQYSIFILLFVSKLVSHVIIDDLDSFEWLTKDGERRPTLKIAVHGETIELPLRDAPFCHLSETKKCDCFILKKEGNSSKWNIASFVKCGDNVRGDFMNSSHYFEIAPKKEGEPGQHIIKNHLQGNDSIETPPEVPHDKQEGNWNTFKYLKPLPEYGQLFENETGFLYIKFVVSKRVFRYRPESEIDEFLQNYVNGANQYLSKLNLLIVYRGWIQALPNDTEMTRQIIVNFVQEERHLLYDKEGVNDAVILIGPADTSLAHVEDSNMGCFKTLSIFVKYFVDESYITRRIGLQILLYALSRGLGIPFTDEKRCGEIPKGIIWIMEGTGQATRKGDLRWANCTIEAFRKRRSNLACLRKNIDSTAKFCGNGLVEDGEECDCLLEECKRCCHEDCKLTGNSECSNGPCCDISKCQFFTIDEGKQCRAADDSCDIPELCNGKSSECPANYVVANGYKCQGPDDKAYCFNGKCGSRLDMCQWAYEDGIVGNDCYENNLVDEKDYGGCGPTFQSIKENISYFACKSDDKLCGKIYCLQSGTQITSSIRFTNESKYFMDKVLNSKIQEPSCLYLELGKFFRGLSEDPTFVPNGSSCGQEKMCVKQTCEPLPKGCPNNCPGKRIKHPYTGQFLPAFLLSGEERPESKPSMSFVWLSVAMLFLTAIGFAIFLLQRKKKRIAEKEVENSSPIHPNKTRKTFQKSSQSTSSALKVSKSTSRASKIASLAFRSVSRITSANTD